MIKSKKMKLMIRILYVMFIGFFIINTTLPLQVFAKTDQDKVKEEAKNIISYYRGKGLEDKNGKFNNEATPSSLGKTEEQIKNDIKVLEEAAEYFRKGSKGENSYVSSCNFFSDMLNKVIENSKQEEENNKEKQQNESNKDKQQDLKNYNAEEIINYYNEHNGNMSSLPDEGEVKQTWIEKLKSTPEYKAYVEKSVTYNHALTAEERKGQTYYEIIEAIDPTQNDARPGESTSENSDIYYSIGLNSTDTAHSLDDAMGDAESFVNSGNSGSVINANDLQQFSQSLYNILLTIGIIIAVIMGGILGIKFMTEAPEGKAEVKKILIPYVVGCVIVFGGFAIWKIVVIVLGNM